VNKNFREGTDALLEAFVHQAEGLADWSAEAIHALIAAVCEQFEVGMGKLAQPIRILISGGSVSPPIDVTLALFGRQETLLRIQRGREHLAAS